jgi:hypothetical protein
MVSQLPADIAGTAYEIDLFGIDEIAGETSDGYFHLVSEFDPAAAFPGKVLRDG